MAAVIKGKFTHLLRDILREEWSLYEEYLSTNDLERKRELEEILFPIEDEVKESIYEEPFVMTTAREKVLDTAKKYVMENRNASYGEPEDNFGAISRLWNSYLYSRKVALDPIGLDAFTTIDPKDVAILMILVKVARLIESPGNEDNWIDIAGYAACGAECVIDLEEPEDEEVS